MWGDLIQKKILLGVIIIIVILVAAFSFFAFAKVDTTLNVNSAFYTDNIIDKKTSKWSISDDEHFREK